METNSVGNVKLIYFRNYGDFSYSTAQDFIISIHENDCGHTEIYAEINGVRKKTMTITQPALSVFRYLSPDEVISRTANLVISLSENNICRIFKNIDELMSNTDYFSKE